MKYNLAYFAWREFTRSSYFGKNMAAKGVLIFLAIYFSFTALVLGFSLSRVLSETFPGQPLISAFNSMILFYAGGDMLLRIFIQNLPTFGFQPFLVFPVKKKRIARYILNKSVFHFFNILPLFLILPFIFTTALKELAGLQLAAWILSLFFMILINHFLAIFIKWKTTEDDRFFYVFLAGAAAIIGLHYFGFIDLPGIFGNLFDEIVQNPAVAIVFPAVVAALYFLNQQYILKRFYLDELSQRRRQGVSHDFSWLSRVGDYGKILSLEVKMIMRNKRPRTSAVMSVLFLAYGLLLYKDYGNEIPEIILVFGGMFMTGIFSMTYGQFFPAWHSRYYSLLMTQNVKMKEVLQSGFFLMASTNVVYYLLSLGYMFITPKVLYIHLAVMLYNVGVNTFVIFAMGLNNRRSVDLDTRAMFNYQGMGATQWLMSFPILFGPIAVFGVLAYLFGNNTALYILGGLGSIGILLHPRLIDYFTRHYLKRKHTMIAAFRNS